MPLDEFEKLVGEGIEAIPRRFRDKLDNVSIVVEDLPGQQHLQAGRVAPGLTLFGLYQGVPQLRRGSNYSGALPDRITIFKLPIEQAARDEDQVRAIVRDTVWHEIAHHFGFSEAEVRAAEAKRGHHNH